MIYFLVGRPLSSTLTDNMKNLTLYIQVWSTSLWYTNWHVKLSIFDSFFWILKIILLAYMNCTDGFLCHIFIHSSNVLWPYSSPLLLFFNYSFIHMCVHCLGHFFPHSPPSSSPLTFFIKFTIWTRRTIFLKFYTERTGPNALLFWISISISGYSS
jgi:hypothetical protein